MEYSINIDSEKYKSFVKCPVCNHQNTHQAQPKTTYNTQEEGFKIDMYCEEGHQWTLFFEEHKGHVYTRIEEREDRII